MPEFVNTGKGMQLIETNNASQVPFQQGNLIIEDSGSIYYDPTNKTDVSGRITVGKADEIVDLGLISGDLQQDDGAILLDVTGQGIYKYRVASGGEEEEEYLINAYNMWVEATTQFRFTYNSMYIRLLDMSTNNGQSVPWIKIATSEDLPKVIDALTSTNPTKDALSVNQVIILYSKIDVVSEELTTHENKNATTAEKGHVQLVNDLMTGGTDKALTAEQGKQLKTALDSIELVESLGAVTSPLTSADTFKDITTPGIYNFTSGGEVGYLIVGGQNNGAQTTQYLLFNNDFYSRESTSSTSWGAWNKCLQSTDVVNNLTSGGINVPLSAEQGKELASSKADKATTLAGYSITDAYTKSEIDTKLSSVYKYIGSVTVEQLPQNLTASDKGNVYNLTNDGTINASTEHEETVVAGDNVAWTGDYWDKLAGTIDVASGEPFVIITSQEELDTMLESDNWLGATRVYFKTLSGSTSSPFYNFGNADLTIPKNVLLLKGIDSAGTHINNPKFDTNYFLIGHRSCNVENLQGNFKEFNLVSSCYATIDLCNTVIGCASTSISNCLTVIGCSGPAADLTITNCEVCIGNHIPYPGSGINESLYKVNYVNCIHILEDTGDLTNLTTTTKTDLVSAINELKTNILDTGITDLGTISTNGSPLNDLALLTDITARTTGIKKFRYETSTGVPYEGILIAADNDSGTSVQLMFFNPNNGVYLRIQPPVGSGVQWINIASYYDSSTGDVTIGGKVNTTGTRDAGNVVIGSGTTTTGDNGVVIGSAAEVTGANNKNAIAIGYEAVAAANGAIQIGQGTNSTANTTQIGNYPLLDATGKIVEDRLPDSVGKDLTGETFIPESGLEVTAGQNTEIFNDYRDIFGPGGSGCEGNLSVGDYSHTEGEGNISYGNSSHTQGKNNISIGESSHTEGYLNTSSGKYSHSEGSVEESDYRTIKITVEQVSPENPLKVTFSPALNEGDIPAYIRIGTNVYPKSVLSSDSSGGIQTDRLNILTFPEAPPGYEISVASSFYLNLLTSGALGDNSHKEGLGTIACSDNQHVQGKYNIEDIESKYAHIIGNGSNNASRSNAHTIDWSGNAWFSGDVKVGGTDYNTATDTLATQSYVNDHSGKKYSTIVIGNSASGLTANDVDYLYTAGTEFATTLINAVNALPSTGGEIKILSGTYTLSTDVVINDASAKPIKITGEGKSTIITSDNPTSYYITASYCEISECKLGTDIVITTNGYVNIHDCEISGRIYINNDMLSIQDIFIHDNNLIYSYDEDFIYLAGGSGRIDNFQIYNNYAYVPNGPFDFLHVAANKNLYTVNIKNNYCPDGNLNFSNYTLGGSREKNISGNVFSEISIRGSDWMISNNKTINGFYLRSGNDLNIINNNFTAAFGVYEGSTYLNIVNNMISTISPYVNLGTNTRFINNVIQNNNFGNGLLPGHNIASNKWGNNMWKDGIDRLVFANGEEIGDS